MVGRGRERAQAPARSAVRRAPTCRLASTIVVEDASFRLIDSEISELLYCDLEPQFDACYALRRFVFEQRPKRLPRDDEPTAVVAYTFARSLKTYRGSLQLCRLGYGEQAGMLNRSLFEDMVVSYWVDLMGDEAVQRLADHHELAVEIYRESLEREGAVDEAAALPRMAATRRNELAAEYGRHGERAWMGKGRSLYNLLGEIEHRWTNPEERALLWRMYRRAHRFNNLLLHHSMNALNHVASTSRIEDDSLIMQAGPTAHHVEGSLFSAFVPLAFMARLAYDEHSRGALEQLIHEWMPLFIRLDPTALQGVGRNDLCPCDSGRKLKHCHGRYRSSPGSLK